MLPKIISFSGGLTSGYMLRREIDRIGHAEFLKQFTTIFCNTGKEHDKTLDFVHDVETKWEIPIVWLEYTRISARKIKASLIPKGQKRANLMKAKVKNEGAHWFRVVNYETASRSGEPFNELLQWMPSLPNVRGRACSAFLKIRNIAKWCHANGKNEWEDYIGMRYDESDRATEILANSDDKGRTPNFPLIESKQTVRDVNAFWISHPFTLNIPNHMGNCDLCFLKAKWKRIAAAKSDPKAAQWWSDWEKRKASEGVTGDGARFRKGQSYESIIFEASQPDLFDLADKTEEDVPCSCAVGGYRANKDDE